MNTLKNIQAIVKGSVNIPFGRVISGDMREISERLDKGVNILDDHTGLLNDLKENTSILNKHTELL